MSDTRKKEPRPRHEERGQDGKYKLSQPCDSCGKPVGTEYGTDDQVCGGTDGPGFYLCSRKRCWKALDGLSPRERARKYMLTRARLDGVDLGAALAEWATLDARYAYWQTDEDVLLLLESAAAAADMGDPADRSALMRVLGDAILSFAAEGERPVMRAALHLAARLVGGEQIPYRDQFDVWMEIERLTSSRSLPPCSPPRALHALVCARYSDSSLSEQLPQAILALGLDLRPAGDQALREKILAALRDCLAKLGGKTGRDS